MTNMLMTQQQADDCVHTNKTSGCYLLGSDDVKS
jgi:hypothetical protein